jgi:hypothetical protein
VLDRKRLTQKIGSLKNYVCATRVNNADPVGLDLVKPVSTGRNTVDSVGMQNSSVFNMGER